MEVVVAVTEERDMLTRLATFDKAVKGASSTDEVPLGVVFSTLRKAQGLDNPLHNSDSFFVASN